MLCALIEKRLSAYLDHQLATHERIEVELHLQECENCPEDLEALQQIKQLLRVQLLPAMPDSLRASIEAETIYKRRSGHWALWVPPLVFAAAMSGWLALHTCKSRQARLEQQFIAGSQMQQFGQHPRVAMDHSADMSQDTH